MRRLSWRPRPPDVAGLTLVELVVVLAVLGVLAAVAMPLAEVTVKRSKELEMRRGLRELREGIDRFKVEYDKARNKAKDAREPFVHRVSVDRTGYPLTLQELMETKILRRIPRDPMAPETPWVIRSYSDSLGSSVTDGRDVWDVRSSSMTRALDGTPYNTW
ncbi:MAG: prepilin-type N-terminal cleavage/methylation domain-containing protein [candidate division NC10 bacterium]|nr:prepilin-type N-terminal cleavage/methylation domain-containing protein [candidate division NC10 bacterium]MBI4413036.1 prepilin-type N-terminal cleavage/methylation domain-containing protein [candidate division NC10 bacterium]